MNYPKLSIVTPSYNQGKYLNDTILSVINQNYNNLEYIIIDGGSTDESIDIIKKYDKYISYWISEDDRGQSNAINKGFKMATGDIFAYINSDDSYYPGTFNKVSKAINSTKNQLIYGNCRYYDQNSGQITNSDVISKFNSFRLPFDYNFIIQPSIFWTRKLWENTGEFNEDLNYGFDWEWIIRASENCEFVYQPDFLSMYRLHKKQKTYIGGEIRSNEIIDILLNNGYNNYGITFQKLLPYKDLINMLVRCSSNYRTGIVIFKTLKILFPSIFSCYSTREVGEILNKVSYLL